MRLFTAVLVSVFLLCHSFIVCKLALPSGTALPHKTLHSDHIVTGHARNFFFLPPQFHLIS